jgi:RNA polymerase sigma factor (sigma-70 family)
VTIDSMKDYLSQIGRYPLLTAEQEIQLSRQVRRMIELQAMEGERSKPEQREIKRGMRARDTIMNCNLRLVVHIAKRYGNRLKCNGLEMMDIIQEGSIGLQRAAELFDGTKGYKFSTYAYWWIRQAITRAIDTKERLIRVPQHLLDKIYRVTRIQRQHLQEHGEPISAVMLAEQMEMTVDELQMIMQRNTPHSSLDQLTIKNGSKLSPLVDLIASDDPDPDDSLAPFYAEQLQLAFSYLNDTDQYVVSAYHGLGGCQQSQREIAESLGISRSAVGQRRERSLRRLRLMMRAG